MSRNPAGREAPHPAAIPGGGWWTILKRVWNTSNDQALWVAAAGVAFFGFYTLIPTLALLVLSYGMLGGGGTVQSWIQELEAVLPDEAMKAIFGSLVATARGSGDQFGSRPWKSGSRK